MTPTPSGSATTPTGSPTPDLRYGTARDGVLDVTGNRTVNDCRELLAAGTATAQVDLGASPSSEFRAGRLVLLLQVQDAFATTNDPAPVTAATAGSAGLWELRRIATVTTAGTMRTLALEAALGHNYASSGALHAQACPVPEYSGVRVEDGQVLGATGWSGTAGGVVAFYVDGTLDLRASGEISADRAGFRGGLPTVNDAQNDVTLDDTTGGEGGGKGEGLDGSAYARQGRGNYANGAGGGNGVNAGGGGGGNGGAGGLGGFQQSQFSANAGTQGRGGATVGFDPHLRLTFGGGGGAGQENNSGAGTGGRGGGVVLVFARRLAGAGAIHADGEGDGTNDGAINDGAGGGGAGGTILLASSSIAPAFSASIRARGGNGGNVARLTVDYGPGGGGGGGRVVVPRVVSTSLVDVSAGARGENSNTVVRGAVSGVSGAISVDD